MSTVRLDIVLSRASKVYRQDDLLCGVLQINCKSALQHEGVAIQVLGEARLCSGSSGFGVVDARAAGSGKPWQVLLRESVQLSRPGCLAAGCSELPFEAALRPLPGRTLHETYHGLDVRVQYTVSAEVRRGLLARELRHQVEFTVEHGDDDQQLDKCTAHAVNFLIGPDCTSDGGDAPAPRIRLRGRLDSVRCRLDAPLTGWLQLDRCDVAIRNVHLLLMRAESVHGGAARTSEVQDLQVAVGDLLRHVKIPLYMVFPRLFTCSALITAQVQVQFSVRLVVNFVDDQKVSESFPLTLYRH